MSDHETQQKHQVNLSFPLKVPKNVSWYLPAVILIFLLSFWIRMLPAQNMEFVQALDPFFISRMSSAIAETGHLPLADVMRYVPYPAPTYLEHYGTIYTPALMHRYFVGPVLGISFADWTRIYPAFMGALMVLILFFVARELFDPLTGVLSSFFLAASGAVLHRSSAGWFDKEPTASVFMFLTLYLFIRAWKHPNWVHASLGGLFGALSIMSWGGGAYLFYLISLPVFIVILLNRDHENLLVAYSPFFVLTNFLPFILNGARWVIPSALFLLSAGVFVLLWIRYLAEKYHRKLTFLPSPQHAVYYSIVLGIVLLILSPLYSATIAGYAGGLVTQALQVQTGIVGNTVAENSPASTSFVINSLGATNSRSLIGNEIANGLTNALTPFGITSSVPKTIATTFVGLSEFFSGWTFSLIGLSLLSSTLLLMLANRLRNKTQITTKYFYVLVSSLFVLINFFLIVLFSRPDISIFFPAWILLLPVIFFLSWKGTSLTERKIDQRWYYLVAFFWLASTLYGSTQRSRLLFLTATPVALMAGYALAKGIQEIKRSSIWIQAGKLTDQRTIRHFLVILFISLLVLFNGANVFATANRIGGSPDFVWKAALDFLRTETPSDSVILSWWDYGYWFQSLGGRASIADGGNYNYYGTLVNYKLADILTEPDYNKSLNWLRNHSVDYVVLDYTMIGKYTAVSQIHNRDNSHFSFFQPFSLAGPFEKDNRTFWRYCIPAGSACNPNQPTIFLPVQTFGNDGFIFPDSPLIQFPGAPQPLLLEGLCTAQGSVEYDVPEDVRYPGCLAFDPIRNQQVAYLAFERNRGNSRPSETDSSSLLVKLLFEDGKNTPEFEKVFERSEPKFNLLVKVWKFNDPLKANQTK